MDIRILRMTIKNFKSFSEKEVFFDGKNSDIYGDNATGKTTIADAFTWILFDKNSLGATSFDAKPIGMDRPEVSVTLVLSVDKREIKLKKVLTEKWTRKRGEENETFTGNESKFFINQIEKKQTEYKAFLDAIISENNFRMLTSADYFLGLKKPEMRAILVAMAGDVSDVDIAGDDTNLIDIVLLMKDKGWSSDDMLKLCRQNIALYNTEQQSIGPRIDEVRRMIPAEADYGQLEAGLVTAKEYISEIESRLSSSRTSALDAAKQQLKVVSVRNKIDQYKRQRIEEANKDFFARKIKIQGAASAIQSAKAKINESAIVSIKEQLSSVQSRLDELAEQYKKLAEAKKAIAVEEQEELPKDATVCDKCGQPLPADKLQEIVEEAKANFIAYKERESEKINRQQLQIINQGNAEKERKERLSEKLTSATAEQESAMKEVVLAQEYWKELSKDDIAGEPSREVDLTGDPAFDAMQEELSELERSISEPDDKTEALLASKSKLEYQVEEINRRLKGKEDREKGLKRIEELTERGKHLSGLSSFEKARQFQVERFIRAKSERLESKINAMFDNISFRLFDVQINGGIVDDCEPLIKNVTYKDASNSERIRGSQEIVKAMQRAQGITVAYFMDNCEAAT